MDGLTDHRDLSDDKSRHLVSVIKHEGATVLSQMNALRRLTWLSISILDIKQYVLYKNITYSEECLRVTIINEIVYRTLFPSRELT